MTQWKITYPTIYKPRTSEIITKAVNKGANILLKQIYRLIIPHKKSGDLLLSWGITPSGGEGDPAVVFSEDIAAAVLDTGRVESVAKPGGVLGPAFFEGQFRIAPGGRTKSGDISKEGEQGIYFKRAKAYAGIHYVAQAVGETQNEIAQLLRLAVERSVEEIITGDIDFTGFESDLVQAQFQRGPRVGQTFFRSRQTGRFAKTPSGFIRGPR